MVHLPKSLKNPNYKDRIGANINRNNIFRTIILYDFSKNGHFTYDYWSLIYDQPSFLIIT